MRFPNRTCLTILWWSWLLLLLASFVAGWTEKLWWSLARQDLRMLSCLALVFAAWLGWWALRKQLNSTTLALVAVGMTLGFYGDSHVGQRLWWPDVEQPLVVGIVLFGLGHLAYMAGFWRAGEQISLSDWPKWRSVMLWQIIALIAWAAVAFSSDRQRALLAPTLAYTLLVAATPGTASALCSVRRTFLAVAWGGGLFLISDILLAWQLFHIGFAIIDELTWICYGGGQMLIVYGTIFAISKETTETVEIL